MEKSDKDYIYYSCEHEWFDGFAKVKYEKNESFLDACDKGSVSVKVWQGLVNRK
jgi:hypothetical protein